MSKNIILLLIFAFTGCIAILSLIFRLFLPWAYFVPSFALVLFLSFLIYRYKRSNLLSICFAIALTYLILRGAYKFATAFTTIPLYDSYTDFALLNVFMEKGQLDPNILQPFSGYPLLHILGWIFSITTTLNPLQTALILPMLAYPVSLLYVYLLARSLLKATDLGVRVATIALLLFSFQSYSTYYDMEFTRFSLAFVFSTMGIYLLYNVIYRDMNQQGRRFSLILLLVVSILSIAHIWASFTFALVLLGIYVLIKLAKRVLSSKRVDLGVSRLHLIFVAFAFVTTFSWWMFYSKHAGSFNMFYRFLLGFFGTGETAFPRAVLRRVGANYSEVLRPYPYTYLLYVRELLVYVPAVVGAVICAKMWLKGKKPKTSFLALLALSIVFIFAFYGVTNILPYRLLNFSVPFTSIFAAIFYTYLVLKKKKLFKVISAFLIVFVGFTAFLAPWSISYLPVYIYDPTVRFEDVGVHNPLYPNLAFFVTAYCNSSYYFLSDDPHLMFLMLPPDGYQSIERLYSQSGLEILGDGQNTYVVELIKLNVQAGPFMVTPGNIIKTKQAIIIYNIIVDSSYYRLYIK